MSNILHPFDEGQFGGKAAALAQLARARLPIPRWFVVSTKAFYSTLTLAQRRLLETADDPQKIGEMLESVRLCESIKLELAEALEELCPNGEMVAVRSSAIDEDGAQHSFAGQLESYLFVSRENVFERIADVWRSAFSPRVIAYRRERGLNSAPQPPAVLIQRMIRADAAGVAFSADPVTGQRGVTVVSAARGVAASLVSGQSEDETWRIARGGSPCRSAHSSVHALTGEQAEMIAELARRAERHFGLPQDIEWAIENGQAFLLQSRPITSIATMIDPDGELCIWDNSNIAESYGGVTTPLTFSFARRAYEEVYRQFCRLMRVSEEDIATHSGVFRRMIGLVRGRIYYNLLNWYRVLALLPGFRVNRRFMEQMMGVRENLPESVIADIENTDGRATVKDGFNLLRSICGLSVNLLLLPKKIAGFHRRLDDALSDQRLEDMRADEIAAHYRDLERRLLTRWDAPLINDFFAMIFYGLLGRACQSWCGDESLRNALLCGQGGIISAEHARRVREMARLAARDDEFVALLEAGSLDQILNRVDREPDFAKLLDDYLEKFGDRCMDELKLESQTLIDDPLPLLRAIGNLAHHSSQRDAARSGDESTLSLDAERKSKALLAGHPLRRMIFSRVLGQARARVRERENLRFLRTRVFGRVRRIFLELGRRFHALGLISSPRDIFYLEAEEALGFVEGTATTTDLQSLVSVRKAEYERHCESETLADRFETRGIVNHANRFQSNRAEPERMLADFRKGTACSPGVARGRARIIRDPRDARIQPGYILIAERTDPGWIMLFASAAGLIVERGSLLSHCAIVAREMGLPCVVASGVMEWLCDGDLIEIDGSAGTITRRSEESLKVANG
jgi:pyruvate,water dikinase